MGCDCETYVDLTLARDAISQRAKATPALVRRLTVTAAHSDEVHVLYTCPTCGSLWQRAIAWNWGAKKYVFRVPPVTVADWVDEPFADPDALLLYAAIIDHMLSEGTFRTGTVPCRVADCGDAALTLSVFCLLHHVEQIVPAPRGRRFGPYARMTRESLAGYLASVAPPAPPEAEPRKVSRWRRG